MVLNCKFRHAIQEVTQHCTLAFLANQHFSIAARLLGLNVVEHLLVRLDFAHARVDLLSSFLDLEQFRLKLSCLFHAFL